MVLEVAVADRHLRGGRPGDASGLAGQLHGPSSAARERRHVGQRHARGAAGHSVLEPTIEGDALLGRRVVGRRQIDAQPQEPCRVHAGLLGGQRDRVLDDRQGTGQQDERERDLPDDERAAPALAASPAGGAAAGVVQHVDEIGPRRLQRGQQPEENRGAEADGGQVAEHAQVEREAQPVRRVRILRDAPEQPDAAHRQGQAAGAGQRREQQVLHEQLPHDTPAARAHRHAHRYLAHAARHAREQQVGHVRARNEEHERHRAQERPEENPNRSSDADPERRKAWLGLFVGVRMPCGEPVHDAPEIGRRLIEGDPRREGARTRRRRDSGGRRVPRPRAGRAAARAPRSRETRSCRA